MASEKTVMAQTRAIIIDRLKWLEEKGAATYPGLYNKRELGEWQRLRDEYEFYTNFLLLEAKNGTEFTEVALSEAVRDQGLGRPRATEV